MTFQSTPSAWRETHGYFADGSPFSISIHSLRMEGDALWIDFRRFHPDFNPLPPHGGRLYLSLLITNLHLISIHSLRMEGDNFYSIWCSSSSYFNPLPPHGGRQKPPAAPQRARRFQSTPSAWRETERNWSEIPP